MSSLPASMKWIRSRTAEKKWQHRFTHYKSMRIFLDAEGQLTPQLVVGSGQIPNSSKLSCMSSLPASMKWIRSRTARQKWQHRFSHYKSMGFLDAQGQLTPQLVVGSGQISNSSKLTLYGIVTCKYEMDPIKNIREKVATPFFPL